MITVTSPVTGGAQTGFTSPTATYVSDVAPDLNGRQWYVSTFGGTGSSTSVRVHTISDPFTALFVSPKVRKTLPSVSTSTGIIAGSVPLNTYMFKMQKGVIPLLGNAAKMMTLRLIVDVPAGADANDSANVRGALSAFIGLLNANSAGFGDSLTVGSF